MRKTLLLIVILFSLNLPSYSQKIDYEKIRNSLTSITCGKNDTLTVITAKQKLESLDTSNINKNIYLYYSDLATSYLLIYMRNKDSVFLFKSIENYNKSLYHKSKYPKAYWQLSFCYYFFLRDCDKGKFYLTRYKKVEKEKYWDMEQIKMLVAKCEK
jgi:hypothetical protein